MSLVKFCAAALLVLSAEAYKFEPLAAQPSPGSVGTFVPASATALTRAAANEPIYDTTVLTAQDPLNPGHATQQGTAAAYTTTTATVTPSNTNGAAGGALAAGVIQIRNGGEIRVQFAANTAFTTTAAGAAQSAAAPLAGFYCAPGTATEMIAANQGVDCGASTDLMAREGAAKFGDFTFNAATPGTMNFMPPSAPENVPANYNGRWLCWLGQSVAGGGTVTSTCPTANAETLWQKVFSVGTMSVTPTPTPIFISPSASPDTTSPSPSPSGAATLSSWLCLITTGAITLLWIQ